MAVYHSIFVFSSFEISLKCPNHKFVGLSNVLVMLVPFFHVPLRILCQDLGYNVYFK